VRVGKVERGDLEATVRASGQVVPAFERVVSSPVEARVLRLLRQPGAILEAGDPILELDTTTIRMQLDQLEEELARIENTRRQRRLEHGKTVAGLRHDIETQQLDVEIAEYRLQQNRKLHANGLIPDEVLKESEVAFEKATIRIEQLSEETIAADRTHETDLEQLDLDARLLRREMEETRRQLELATPRADHSGVLTWVTEEAGATVRRGDLLARIADLESFRVEASIADSYAPRLETGQPVHVLIGDESLPATLTRILPTIEGGTVRFVVELEQPSHSLLRHNLRVDVLVVTGSRRDVLKIPRGPYIRGGGDLHQVFVIRGDRAVRRDVRLGLVGHQYYELVDGLVEGDELILSDMNHRLHAERIRVK
jgi:HlyD family secretion protein